TSSVLGAHIASPAIRNDDPVPLQWKWVTLDPDVAGRRAYKFYREKNGCGAASYQSILSLLNEKVGHPWTTLPDEMMTHAGSGYGGQGTLCGALGGASCIISLAMFAPGKDADYKKMIDWLFSWYEDQEFPTDRFDDMSPKPKQIKVKPMTPLCHSSVSGWVSAAGVSVNSEEKIERCSKVAGEVVYNLVKAINEYYEGKWNAAAWNPPKEIEHCIDCHGKNNMNNQQGHMKCGSCHTDHTK
ncbi:MAG: C-GCAxxG-C-C family protein, partial [Ignavibacteria bacterium]|nr:C-GCAxxG-C-C family protein [Ignavibacteria bacterium]